MNDSAFHRNKENKRRIIYEGETIMNALSYLLNLNSQAEISSRHLNHNQSSKPQKSNVGGEIDFQIVITEGMEVDDISQG